MFIGHFAVGFAIKKAEPKLSLGTLFFAVLFIDLIWPFFLLLGIEKVKVVPGITAVTPLDFVHYPFSHSLLAVALWAVLLSMAYAGITKAPRAAMWISIAVTSHWALDAISHRPDLPLYPGSGVFIGLGLWYSYAGTVAVEGGLFAAGVFLYSKTTRPADRVGKLSLWALVGFLIIIYAANIFGPPPPDSQKVIAASALLLWLFIPWGYWIDRHRI